jgi:hypothetical protein
MKEPWQAIRCVSPLAPLARKIRKIAAISSANANAKSIFAVKRMIINK